MRGVSAMMRGALGLVLTGVVIAGCGSDGFKIRKASCDNKFFDWAPGLTHHILQGDGDGDFDYDPTGDALARVWGSYDLNTGDFSWEVATAQNHYLRSRVIEGYGYADMNGDLDIVGTTVTTDVLDDSWESQFRIQRNGCEMDERIRFESDGETYEQVETGTFGSEGYEYTQSTDYEDYIRTVTGELRPDLSYSETAEVSVSGYSRIAEIEGSHATGESREDFVTEDSQGDAPYSLDGFIDRFIDGGRHVAYDVSSPGTDTGTWDYEIDYEGNGSGTYSEPSFSCDLTFTNFECSYDCGGSSTGNC